MLMARLDAFMQYGAKLIGQVHDHVAYDLLLRHAPMPDGNPEACTLVVSVKFFDMKEEKTSSS